MDANSITSIAVSETDPQPERVPRPAGLFLNRDLSVTMSNGTTEMTIKLTPELGVEWGINLIVLAHEVCARTAAPRNPKLEN